MSNLITTSPAIISNARGTIILTNSIESQQDYIVGVVKCFLCDRTFVEGEEPWLIFEKRIREDGQTECSLSAILASALGRDLEENKAHSTLLCDECNRIILDFETLEQRFCEARYRILTAYNSTAKRNKLQRIPIEINGILQDSISSEDENDNDELDDPIIKEEYAVIENSLLSNYDIVSNVVSDADLIEEIQDNNDDDNSGDVKHNLVATEPFTTIHHLNKYDDFTMMTASQKDTIAEYSVENKDSVINVAGVKIDGQDIIIYDEALDDDSVPISYKEHDDDESMDSQTTLENVGSYTASDVVGSTDGDNTNLLSLRPQRDNQQSFYEKKDGNTYVCLVCPVQRKFNLKPFAEHMRRSHNVRFHTCDLCDSGFVRRQELNDHLDEKHSSNGDGDVAFICETCQRSFTNYRLYRIHKRMHYSSTKQHECVECHKKYGSKNLLDEHMNMHTGQRPYKCSKCPKDFASKYTLQTHMKIHTERQRPYQCDECDKSFLNQQNLTQHKKLHVGIKSFICDVCSKAFGTQHNLDVHKIVHTGQRPFICRTCGKSFARRAEIKDHERTHTGERPFKCDLCGLAFAQRSNLMSHKKSTHLNEKLHKCDQCDRSFKRRRLLEYHINAAHTGERPHKCEICGATFVYPEHHKKHMLIHSGQKPFACEVCGREFNSRENRNAHRFVHSDKKPYECLECGTGFGRKPLLLAHMKRMQHINDTIIVNQPQITGEGTLSLSRYEISFVDRPGNANGEEIFPTTEDAFGDIIVSEESIFTQMQQEDDDAIGDNNHGDDDDDDNMDDDDDNAVNGQLIKDQIGDVKYLQFEELDKDGHQTLTWVDIGDKD